MRLFINGTLDTATTAATDANTPLATIATVLVRYEYDVFGAIRSETGTSDNTRKFTGKEFDADSNLYYYAARYYDPYIGRFTQRAPIGDGVNWYAYTHNNLLQFIDPDRLRDLKPHEKTAAEKIFRDMIDLEQVGIEESGARFSFNQNYLHLLLLL